MFSITPTVVASAARRHLQGGSRRSFRWGLGLVLTLAGAGQAAEATRLPLPQADQLAAANHLINDTLQAEIRGVKTLEQAQALVHLLLNQATPGLEPAQRYALLIRAREMAAKIGEVEAARSATTELTTVYLIPPQVCLNQTWDLLDKGNLSPEGARLVVDWISELAAEAAEDDHLPLAIDLVNRALKTASRTRDAAVSTQLRQTLADYQEQKARLLTVTKAQVVLESTPDDPEACTIVGTHLAVAKRTWDAALPLLAKGLAGELKTAAAAELAATDGVALAQAGNLWLKAAENLKGPAKVQISGRVITVWERVLADPELPITERVKLQKNLDRQRELQGRGNPAAELPLFARRLKILSAGFDSGNRITVSCDGKTLIDAGGEARGLTLIAWSGVKPTPVVTTFDTFGNTGEQTELLTKAITALPLGSFAVVAAADAVGKQSPALLKAIQSLGGQRGVGEGFRMGYILIGRKGLPAGQAIELASKDALTWPAAAAPLGRGR